MFSKSKMFARLKFRMLMINLIMLTILMSISFVSIYVFNYTKTMDNIEHELIKFASINEPSKNVKPEPPKIPSNEQGPPRMISFVLTLDKGHEIINVNSSFIDEDDFYKKALEVTDLEVTKTSKFTLEDDKWAYKINTVNNETRVYYIQITHYMDGLDRLLLTFLFVFFIMLILNGIGSSILTNRSIKPIKEAFEKQNQFITDASHELKTPLTIMKTNTDVLLKDPQLKDNKWLGYIDEEITRMAKLTNHLLYLAKVEDGSVEIIMSRINLSDILEKHLLISEALMFEKGIMFESNIEEDLFINGSNDQISQLVLILLENAIKYNTDKGSVSIRLNKVHQHAVIEVENTCCNQNNIDTDKIFDRFYKADSSRAGAGDSFGLGLSIAKSIVDHHKGKISCKIAEDSRIKFSVKFEAL